MYNFAINNILYYRIAFIKKQGTQYEQLFKKIDLIYLIQSTETVYDC